MNYLERYRNGEFEQVWNELQALGPAVRRELNFTQAQDVAAETMRRVERNCFGPQRVEIDCGPEPPLRFIAIEYLEELGLLRHAAQAYSQTLTSEPAAKPSLSSPTITNPSARVVDDRIDAPPTASGSTRSPSIFTRT